MPGNYSDTSNIVDATQADAADVKTPIDDLDDALYNNLHGEVPTTSQLRFDNAGTALEITAGGAITISRTYHKVENNASAASDNLDDILGYNQGDFLVLEPNNTSSITVVRHNGAGTGNIRLTYGTDYYLTGNRQLVLFNNGTYWIQLGGDYGAQYPRFKATKTGTQALTGGIAEKVQWETTVEQIGGAFSLANERWIPSVVGLYRFEVNLYITAWGDGEFGIIYLYKDGTSLVNITYHTGSAQGRSLSIEYTEYMALGSYMEVWVFPENAATLQNDTKRTYFKGHLVNGIKES